MPLCQVLLVELQGALTLVWEDAGGLCLVRGSWALLRFTRALTRVWNQAKDGALSLVPLC